MSVCNLKGPDPWTRATFSGHATVCFLCGREVSDIGVGWKGHAPDAKNCPLIILHPGCATDLGCELIGDARNAERILANKPLTAGVDKSLLPQGEA